MKAVPSLLRRRRDCTVVALFTGASGGARLVFSRHRAERGAGRRAQRWQSSRRKCRRSCWPCRGYGGRGLGSWGGGVRGSGCESRARCVACATMMANTARTVSVEIAQMACGTFRTVRPTAVDVSLLAVLRMVAALGLCWRRSRRQGRAEGRCHGRDCSRYGCWHEGGS